MSGVTWNERSDNDWLASNGRWYPRSKYPAGWGATSLPPAPEHASGAVGSILRRAASLIEPDGSASGSGPLSPPSRPSRPATPTPPRQQAPPSPGRADASGHSFLPKEPQRPTGPADAQVVRQRTYKPKVAPGPPPPSALPPPPGRVRDAGNAPSPPAPPNPAPPAVSQTPPPRDQSDLEIVAGDLGKVLGVAKRRISRAINEAAEQGR